MAEEDSKLIKKDIARLSFLIGNRILIGDKSELVVLNSALLLLNQANSIADIDVKDARKLLSLARRIKVGKNE